MALSPIDEVHAQQIQAGILGRKAGHKFEDELTQSINSMGYPLDVPVGQPGHLFSGNPGTLLVGYAAQSAAIKCVRKASAISTGALATSEEGKQWLAINGASVSRCKSDIVLTLSGKDGTSVTLGVSTKQCNNVTPTNAQLYFTTARGFVALLRANGILVSDEGLRGMRQFCGDNGFRPSDDPAVLRGRSSDPRRYFWEEISPAARAEWEGIFTDHQDTITQLLLQKAYLDDPFVPDLVLHKTKRSSRWATTEVALYTVDELTQLSRRYQGYATRAYSVRKGSYRDQAGVSHLAPRFGIVQMQRGGQRQHPEQLQFNLEAGYFYRL